METSCNSRKSPNSINYWCIAMAVKTNTTIDFIWLFFPSLFTVNSCLVQMSEYHTFLAHLGNSTPTSFDLPVWAHVVLWWTIEFLCLLRCFSCMLHQCRKLQFAATGSKPSRWSQQILAFWLIPVQRVEKAIK